MNDLIKRTEILDPRVCKGIECRECPFSRGPMCTLRHYILNIAPSADEEFTGNERKELTMEEKKTKKTNDSYRELSKRYAELLLEVSHLNKEIARLNDRLMVLEYRDKQIQSERLQELYKLRKEENNEG